jgi:hypothetical protein
MNSFDDDKIARLLRLKRYELPPPGYFENFLHDFRRRRQQDELVREPLWSICVDRLRDLVFQHNVPPLAWYSAGMAALVGCAAIISVTLYQQPDTTQFVQSSPVPTTPPITEKELDLAPPVFPATFDMRPTLLPTSRNVPGRSRDRLRSDEFTPLQHGWESVEDLPLPDE